MRPSATDVIHSVVCVCVGLCVGTQASGAKMAELVKMPFGELTHVGPRNQVLDGVKIHHGNKYF